MARKADGMGGTFFVVSQEETMVLLCIVLGMVYERAHFYGFFMAFSNGQMHGNFVKKSRLFQYSMKRAYRNLHTEKFY